jgi:tetratricopeptide (TPR) repeat protein
MSSDTSMAGSSPGPITASPDGGWLFGRATDLLFGAGLGYLLSLPLLMWLTLSFGMHNWPTPVFILFSLAISGPHYGATILRVYEHREDRKRYVFFALWATLAIGAAFVAGLNHVLIGSLLVTVYASWSPWHFSGQNYGLAVMFLRRRGVPLPPVAKRLLYASFILAYALSFLVMHGQSSVVSHASVPVDALSTYQFVSIGIPGAIISILVPLTAIAYALSIVGCAVHLLRGASIRDLGPAACLVLTQSLWFALPAAMPVIADQPLHGLAFTIVWISAAHGLQYLWVNYYYARAADDQLQLRSYMLRTLMAGSAVTIFPSVIFAPGFLGSVPWDSGLAILLVSAVNIHHFVLDGAIWKLRDGKVAKFLLGNGSPATPRAKGETRDPPKSEEKVRTWFRPAMVVLGLVSLAVALLDSWEREVTVNRSGGDISRMMGAAKRLAWIGRDSPLLHAMIAQNLAAEGRLDDSVVEYEESLALFPTEGAWVGLGRVQAGLGRWQEASESFRAAIGLNPDSPAILAHSGQAYMHLGRPDLARVAFERASALAPNNQTIGRELAKAIAAENAEN